MTRNRTQLQGRLVINVDANDETMFESVADAVKWAQGEAKRICGSDVELPAPTLNFQTIRITDNDIGEAPNSKYVIVGEAAFTLANVYV